jgi:hypothetical protein
MGVFSEVQPPRPIDHCRTYRMKVPFQLDSLLLLLLVINAIPMENQKRGQPGTVMVASWKFPH